MDIASTTKVVDQTNLAMATVIIKQLALLGMIEASYSRTKAIGYMPLHTRIFIGRNGNPDFEMGVDLRLRKIGCDPARCTNTMRSVQMTNYVYQGVNVAVYHEGGEVISVTVQYLAD